MASIQLKKTQAFIVADAESVLKASVRHWALIRALGATEAERKAAEATSREAAEALLLLPDEDGPTLDDVRQALKDLLGDYRSSADLVADGFQGADPKVQKALRIGEAFPRNDRLLGRYVAGLAAIVRKYSAKLGARGFKKEDQDALVEQIAVYQKLLASRGSDRGERRAERVAVEALFERLRHQTSYFRRLGRKALRTDDRRAEFDRVKLAPKAAPRAAAAPSNGPANGPGGGAPG